MKTKRILAWMLSLLMLATLVPTMAFAEEPTGFDNFKKVRSYTDGTFEDVENADWFYENVKSVYEIDLMIGRSETDFAPEDNMTVAEAFTLAARLNSIYKTGKSEFAKSEPWYKAYTDYCKANGIADSANYDLNAPVTRAQFAEIFANALPEEALARINQIADNAIPDVKLTDSFAAAVYQLYRAGILVGNDEKGTFAPNSNIRRMEVAAISTRMAIPALRQEISLSEKFTVSFDLGYDGKTLDSITVESGEKITAPKAPEQSGYTFAGWYTAKTGGTKFDFSKAITADVTLYARWNKRSSGGGGGSSSKTLKTIAEVLATVPDFPVSTDFQKTADNSWVAEDDAKCYRIQADDPELGAIDAIAFGVGSGPTVFSLDVIAPVTKSGNNYAVSFDTVRMDFVMSDGKLASVSVSGLTYEQAIFNGKTFTAPKPETRTLAQILATNTDFPIAEDDLVPENAWVSEDGAKAFVNPDGMLCFDKDGNPNMLDVDTTNNFTQIGDNFVLEGIDTTFTCIMKEGKLDSIKVETTDPDYADLAGTYAPAPETKGIGEILDTVENFPSNPLSGMPAPANAWVNENGQACYEASMDYGFFALVAGDVRIAFCRQKEAEKKDGVYSYTDEEAGCTFIFTMKNDVLESIEVKGSAASDGVYAPAASEIKYMAWDDANKKLVEKSTTEAIEVTNSTTTLEAGKFYVVKGADVTTGTLKVNGTTANPTTLILADGAKLTATGKNKNAGINVALNYVLVITGQQGGTGTLIAKGNNSSAGIGGDENDDGGTVTINGGNITATGGECGAGIGGGDMTDGGAVTINGGVVTANGGKWGAGIGSGDDGTDGGTVTINGGTVTATGGDDAAAIGGGSEGGSSILTFGEGVNFTIKAGTDKDNTETKTTTEYANDHSAKYVHIEEASVESLTDGYYLVGKLNGVEHWSADSLTADMKLEANESVPGEYKLDWTFCDGDGVKVAKVQSGAITTWYKDGMDNEYKTTTEGGNTGEGTLYFRPEGNAEWTYFYLTVKPKEPVQKPNALKAVYDTNNDANTLTFYYDKTDHSGTGITVYENGTANFLFDNTQVGNGKWGYYSVRNQIKDVVIDSSVQNYKGLTSTAYMFYSVTNAKSISGTEYLDVSNVTDMAYMFYGYGSNLTTFNVVPDVSGWNTAKVTDMSGMFDSYGRFSIELNAVPNVSGWNTANVTNMANVFYGYGFVSTALNAMPNVAGWNTAKVTNMDGMFCDYGQDSAALNCSLDLSAWDVSKVMSYSEMFSYTGYKAASDKWSVKIPAKTGDTVNTDQKWFVGNGTDDSEYITPASGRSFTLGG